jgi:uncharacterized protein involved in type VI secretion and phage assembly
MATFHRAVVCSNQDPKKLGRIQVRYPHIEKDEEKPSEWALLCQPYASKQSGMWFIPEEGDEVLVYLESNDLENPTVLGSLFNELNLPPHSENGSSGNADGKNDLKFLRTRSGHALSFNDSDSKQEVVLQDAKGSKLVLSATDETIELTDSHSNRIRLDGEKITIVNSKGSVVVLDGDRIQIESKSISLSADKVSIEKANAIELGSGASEALVKGQSFMQFFNTHTHLCSGPGGSSSPPVAPMTPAMLSQKVKTV